MSGQYSTMQNSTNGRVNSSSGGYNLCELVNVMGREVELSQVSNQLGLDFRGVKGVLDNEA